MELTIQLVCPECNSPPPVNINDLAPGRRSACNGCHIPVRMTHDSLEQFSRDVRIFCENR